MWSSTTTLATVDLAIYALLLPFTVWTLLRHGKHSIPGHLFLWGFFVLRFVTDGLTISERDDATLSEATLIIGNVGLPPMLLALSGFDYETYYNTDLLRVGDGQAKPKIVIELFVHMIVVVGIVMLAIGYSNIYSGASQRVTMYQHLAQAGSIVLMILWLFLFMRAIASFYTNRHARGGLAQRLLFKLSLAVLFATASFGVRVIETVVFAFTSEIPTFAEDVVLVYLSQYLSAMSLVIGLIASKNLKTEVWLAQDSLIKGESPRVRPDYE